MKLNGQIKYSRLHTAKERVYKLIKGIIQKNRGPDGHLFRVLVGGSRTGNRPYRMRSIMADNFVEYQTSDPGFAVNLKLGE